ncbi:cell death-related nuclease 6-like [Drosophila albomicans]|uniref:Cell death-related nuclease 6-like n=1 Tax=Drosophila albomicans TaxID=7291 RepID=A0A6P8XCX1_DROAB|nr:cell death-related nuclease 6-like [Drosophila albomicans]
MRLICLCLWFLIAIVVNVSAYMSCKDEDNNYVDWWFMYLQDDEKYIYVTSENYNKWQMSNETLMSNRSLLSRASNFNFLIGLASYNDVFTNGTTFDWGGASRGWIAASPYSGIWMIYSIPLDDNKKYGNNFLCLSLDEKGVEKAAELLVLSEPHFNLTRQSKNLVNIHPLLYNAINPNTFTTGDLELDVELRTLKGRKFRFFGKHPSIYKEFYADIVARRSELISLCEPIVTAV